MNRSGLIFFELIQEPLNVFFAHVLDGIPSEAVYSHFDVGSVGVQHVLTQHR